MKTNQETEMITKVNVLLVDDDPVSHLIRSKILQYMGVSKINTVANGIEALNFVKSSEKDSFPDIIFVDINMPVLNGFGFIEAFMNLSIPDKGKIHIILLTSSSNPLDLQRAKELGVCCLTKPMSENSIRPILESLASN